VWLALILVVHAVYLVTHQILVTPLCTVRYKELVAVQGLSLLSLKTSFFDEHNGRDTESLMESGIPFKTKNKLIKYVLLPVHLGMILVNNQLDEHFFMYVYFCSLHVLGSHVPIIRRIIVSV